MTYHTNTEEGVATFNTFKKNYFTNAYDFFKKQVWFQNKRSKERRMKQIFIRGKKSSGGVSLNVYNNISSSASTLDIILDSQDNFYYENDAVVEVVDKNLEIQQESSQIKTNSTTTTLTGFQNFTDFMINTEEPHHQEEIFESSPTLGQGIK